MDILRGLGVLAAIGFLILLLFAAVKQSIKEREEWCAYSTQHCKIVGRQDKKTSTTFMPIVGTNSSGAGFGVTSTPEQIGWLCDDGVTYWKEKSYADCKETNQ